MSMTLNLFYDLPLNKDLDDFSISIYAAATSFERYKHLFEELGDLGVAWLALYSNEKQRRKTAKKTYQTQG